MTIKTVWTKGFYDESSNRTVWTDSGVLRENAAVIYNLSVAEVLSASDSAGSAHSVGESGTAADTVSSTKTLHPAVSESLTAAETAKTIHAATDSLTAADTSSSTKTYHPSVAESLTAAATVNELYIAHPTVSESLSAADLTTGGTVFHNTVSESGSTADTATDMLTVYCAVVEAAAALDSASLLVTFNLEVDESGSAADVVKRIRIVADSEAITDEASNTITYNPRVVETWRPAEAFNYDIDGKSHVSVVDSLALADTITLLGNIKTAAVTETLHAATVVASSNDGNFNVHLFDTLHAQDDRASNAFIYVQAGDILTAQDHTRVPRHGIAGAIWDVSVSEQLNAQDIPLSQQTFTSPGLTFWGYRWAFVPGQTTKLAVWCGGLDCGDHIVKSNGSVFVPWRSDPDGKFDPGWLVVRSLFPPATGYGATGCNIDLTTTTNQTIRLVVDLAIGLPYRSRLQLLAPDAPALTNSQYGPSLAQTRRLHQYGAQLSGAQGLSVGTQANALRPMDFRQPNGDKYPRSQMFSGIQWGQIDDDYGFDSKMMAEITRPYPATIVALVGFLKSMDRE